MRKFDSSWLIGLFLAISMGNAFGGDLLVNGDFNNPDDNLMDYSGWYAWWSGERPCGRETWADRAYNGRGFAVYGWGEGSLVGIYQNVAATCGVTYTFTVWVKKEIHYDEAYTELKLEWKDADMADLGGSCFTNLTSQTGPTYALYSISGSTTNLACAYVRPVIYAQWNTPTVTESASMQFDDAALTIEPAAVILISRQPHFEVYGSTSGRQGAPVQPRRAI